MTEPCERCGTAVAYVDLNQRPAVVLSKPGLPAAFEVYDGPGWYDMTRTSSLMGPGEAAIYQPHTPDRCRSARRQQEPR